MVILVSAVLLPYDIVTAVRNIHPDQTILFYWHLIYWNLFVLNWIIYPLFTEALRLGSFREAMRTNAYFWISYVIGAIILVAWYTLTFGFKGITEMLAYFNALGYTFGNLYGLVMISLSLGFAFVALPQHLHLKSQPEKELELIYAKVTSADERRLTSKFDLEDAYNAIKGIKLKPKAELIVSNAQKFLSSHDGKISNIKPSTKIQPMSASNTTSLQGPPISSVEKNQFIGRLADALGDAERSIFKYEELVTECIKLENFINHRDMKPYEIAAKKSEIFACKIGSYIYGWLSVIIIIAQATILLPYNWLSVLGMIYSLVIKHYLTHTDSAYWSMVFQLLVGFPLIYGFVACFWASFKFKLFAAYGLYDQHKTDPYSLMCCVSIMSRIALSLCFNYIYVLRIEDSEYQTAFMSLMRKSTTTLPLLGESANALFPFMIMVLAILQYTQTYHKMVHWLGLSSFQMESAVIIGADLTASNEGRNIVNKERVKRRGKAATTAGDGGGGGGAGTGTSVVVGRYSAMEET
jgi:LMBR1-like membrane protein